jgi:hypothetical protein
MAEKLDPEEVVTFEELFWAMMFESEAVRRLLVQKGLPTNGEVLERSTLCVELKPSSGGDDPWEGFRETLDRSRQSE